MYLHRCPESDGRTEHLIKYKSQALTLVFKKYPVDPGEGHEAVMMSSVTDHFRLSAVSDRIGDEVCGPAAVGAALSLKCEMGSSEKQLVASSS